MKSSSSKAPRRAKPKKPATSAEPAVRVTAASTHNLKAVTCRMPHGKLTVVTGPSGAGKSSLAFDTVYAEAQRRFVESMSTYARQFLEKMERPPVEAIEGVLPTVALEAKNSVKNARSTVGTITEVQDVLRLLYANVGVTSCPEGHGPAVDFATESLTEDLLAGEVSSRYMLVTRVARPDRGADGALVELVRQGYGRVLVEGAQRTTVERIEEEGVTWPKKHDPLPLVLGRFGTDPDSRARLQQAIDDAWGLGGGELEVHPVARGDEDPGSVRVFRRGLSCPVCARSFRRPVAALFSFNSPLGACDECQGFGRVMGIDHGRVIPDVSRSLAERPIAPWNSPAYEELYDGLLVAAEKARIPTGLPVSEFNEEQMAWLWHGDGFTNLGRFFAWLERRIYKMHVRILLSRYRAYTPCPTCEGSRLVPEASWVTLKGERIDQLQARPIAVLRDWLAAQEWSERERCLAGPLLEQLEERVDVLYRVGLGYLTLNRQARTLSGGETQRIHLAAALGSGLTSTMYVLDEPTVGLHALDSAALLALLQDLAARGNTVVVVEHDPVLVRGADWLIDLGPRAGEHGGELMAEGDPRDVLRHESSLTARFLGPDRPLLVAEDGLGEKELAGLPRVEIVGARENNLDELTVAFPRQALVAVTGVSGSGKSTLINQVLYANVQRSRGVVQVDPGAVSEIRGTDELRDVVLVDQRPIGRSSRSNPVTYVKAYDEVRKIFAARPAAVAAGITPGHFSFNVDKGRCPECQGTGTTEVDMHFMAAVEVTCDSCNGRRFKPEVLRIQAEGLTIDQALELTVEQALSVFRDKKPLVRRLQPLVDAGLSYLRLGQSTATLSGGEAQRLKLASFLGKGRGRPPEGRTNETLFLFDEPTTGLHLADIDQLYRTLRQLTARGDGVVVVEHSLELIARCDWVVDLGPGGGSDGGRVLFTGPMKGFLRSEDSPTARALRA